MLNFHTIIDSKTHFMFGGKNISLNLTLPEVLNIHNFHNQPQLAENIFPTSAFLNSWKACTPSWHSGAAIQP
jgi:hypothetical protein